MFFTFLFVVMVMGVGVVGVWLLVGTLHSLRRLWFVKWVGVAVGWRVGMTVTVSWRVAVMLCMAWFRFVVMDGFVWRPWTGGWLGRESGHHWFTS